MKITKIMRQRIAAGLSILGVSSASQAALPAAVPTAFATLNTDAMALIDLAWTVAIPVSVAFIIIKLFKKSASSAT